MPILILPKRTPAQISFTYASEADMLNVVLFGKTAKEWRELAVSQLESLRGMETSSISRLKEDYHYEIPN